MKAVRVLILLLLVMALVPAYAVDKQPIREITEFAVGSDPEIFASIVPTASGGALLAGFTSSNTMGQMDAYLAEIDENSDLLWESTYGDTLSEEFYQALPVAGGGYIAVGTSNSYGDKAYDQWIVRLDNNHEEIWSRSLGEDEFGVATQVVPDGEGGWYIGGFQNILDEQRASFWVARMDDDGEIIWNNIYGGPEHDFLTAMVDAPGGGVVVAGSTHSFTSENRDGYIVKIDEDGTQVWQRVIGGPWPDYFNGIIRNVDNQYVLIGTTHRSETSEESDMSVVLVNDDSEVLFQTAIGGDSWDEGWGIVQLPDEGYYCVGSSYNPDAGVMNGYGVRLNSNGDILWYDTFGDNDGYQEFRDVIMWDTDNSLVKAVGYTSSTDNGDADFHTRLINYDETVVPNESVVRAEKMELSRAFPNPFNATTKFSVNLPVAGHLEVAVYNLLGQEVRLLTSGRWAAGQHTFEWHAENVASGTYVIQARTGSQSLRQRIMLVK